MERRTFLETIGATTAMGLLPHLQAQPQQKESMEEIFLRFFATNWGFSGSWDAFCAKAKKDGYDGIEVWCPQDAQNQSEMVAAVRKHELALGFLIGTSHAGETDFNKIVANYEQYAKLATSFNPVYINSHTGKDYLTFEQNKRFLDVAATVSEASGIRIMHETHRMRALFAAHIAKQYIEKVPNLRLTLDISHWCNVHESYLDDQPEAVQLALQHTDHIHARVGHPEGPQVNDPRAPEWQTAVQKHLAWWDKIVELKRQKGKSLTVLTEFGPPTYMPTLPYTQQPVADQWDINVYMMKLFKERYK